MRLNVSTYIVLVRCCNQFIDTTITQLAAHCAFSVASSQSSSVRPVDESTAIRTFCYASNFWGCTFHCWFPIPHNCQGCNLALTLKIPSDAFYRKHVVSSCGGYYRHCLKDAHLGVSNNSICRYEMKDVPWHEPSDPMRRHEVKNVHLGTSTNLLMKLELRRIWIHPIQNRQ